MQDYMTIAEAAKYLRVSRDSLRRWERDGLISPLRTKGNQRRYTKEMLDEALGGKRAQPQAPQKMIVGYCRVSSNHQKEDLARQKQVVQTYCEKQGVPFKMLADVGSGLNYQRSNFLKLIHLICTRQCSQVVVNYQDRLVRFGFDLVKAVCQENHVELTVINQTSAEDPNQELVQDVLSVITVFSAKLYGRRSHRNETIVRENKQMFTQDN